jgi:hypothetical protein
MESNDITFLTEFMKISQMDQIVKGQRDYTGRMMVSQVCVFISIEKGEWAKNKNNK